MTPSLAPPVNITVVAALAVGAWAVAKLVLRARTWRKHGLSERWPIADGFFQSATVNSFRTGYAGEGVKFRLRVEFSYQIGDFVHAGVYIQDFGAQEDALALVRSLERGPLCVRYDPVSPSRYVIDPYRDVWLPEAQNVPQVGSQAEQALAPVRKRGGHELTTWTNSVSLGQPLIFQVCAAIFLYLTSERNVGVFWFLAGGHGLGAVMTTGCCWWRPTGGPLPTWVGRLTLAVIACGWLLAARFLS